MELQLPFHILLGRGRGNVREVKERQLTASLRLEPGKLLMVDSIRDRLESQKILRGLVGVLPYVVLQGDLHQTGGELIHDTWATLVQGVVAFPILLQIGSPLSWILLGNPSAAAGHGIVAIGRQNTLLRKS